ncbi:hypothetical protein [Prevotella sp. 10(H)]|uniref:hypothetical protein n=1 Tax=Prevotella sp. 10(H) TaxID=1158294 RepID=UPI0004A71198|nr:hypothetical protein [Prevotella sp. 10(H)]
MKLASLLIVIFSSLFFMACSTVDSDAKKAAELNKESIEYVKAGNLMEAERIYKESKEIVSRYKGTEKYNEFSKAYSTYMYGKVEEE